MNEPFTNNPDPKENEIAEKLHTVAGQTHATPYFVNELEEQLRTRHKPKAGWFLAWREVSPSLGWVALVLAMSILLIWSIRTLVPAPQPATDQTPTAPADTATPTAEPVIQDIPTPGPQTEGYDWRGAKLFLSVPLPQSRGGALVYLLKDEEPATMDMALALANQFGFQGEVYEVPGDPGGATVYLVTDGRQRLMVQSTLHYDYYADYGAFTFMSGDKNLTAEQAATVIDSFLKAHGFEFEYELQDARQTPGMFFVLPLTPDGMTIWHDYNIPARIEFTIGEDQQVIRVSSYQVSYGEGGSTYGIRTAEEAFQQVLGQSDVIQNGVLEIMRSGGESDASFWSRSYPDNQTVTLFAQPTYYPAAVQGTAPFVSIGSWVVTGNIVGLEQVDRTTYVEATGQFSTEAGIRKFKVDSWKVTTATETYLSGSLRREGDQIILTADDGSGEYVIEDAPADVPLDTTIPDNYLAVQGFMREGKLDWQTINYLPTGSGSGGGGGGGTGFYQLNLSGTPVPLPTPSAPIEIRQGTGEYTVREGDTLGSIASSFGISIDELMQANNLSDPMIYIDQKLIIPGPESQAQDPNMGRRFENLRGLFMETIYKGPDGGQRIEYSFIASTENESFSFILVGEGLETLEPYHNRPVDISGVIEKVDQYGGMTFRVEKFSVPFPDLKIELFEGTQENTTVNGQPVTLFTTTDGQQYVLFYPYGGLDDTTVAPNPPLMLLEALAIPGETYGGYPALRLFGSTFAEPRSGSPTEVTVTADQPYVVDETPGLENYVPPSATIERVELVYYIPDPLYSNTDATNSTGARYIQPAWRFYGHYSNGGEFAFLVQALKQEFLLPELAPYRAPG